MFEKVHETLNKIDMNKTFISEYGEKLKQLSNGGHFVEEHREVAAMGIEAKIRKIENKILYDNARIELFNEVMPNALTVWNSYENKPYGEKTKARIKEKVRELTGCWFYAEWKQYGCDEFSFCVDYQRDSKLHYFFNSKSFDVCPVDYDKKFLVFNKIQKVEFDELKLSWCNKYIEDTYSEAKRIYEEVTSLEEEFSKIEMRVHELNTSLPSLCEPISLGYPRWYDIA